MPRWSEVVDLIKVTQGKDADGYPADIETVRENIYANKKSVRSSEFYQASQQGIRLSLMIEIRSIDYEEETDLKYNGRTYEIVRTYDKGEIIELICQSK